MRNCSDGGRSPGTRIGAWNTGRGRRLADRSETNDIVRTDIDGGFSGVCGGLREGKAKKSLQRSKHAEPCLYSTDGAVQKYPEEQTRGESKGGQTSGSILGDIQRIE